MRASSGVQFRALPEVWRHARGRKHCRGEPGSALSGGCAPDSAKRRAARSSTCQGSAEPLCVRIKGANREVSDGKADVLHVFFSSYEGHEEQRTGKIHGTFSGMHMALDGWMLARAPASPAQGLHHHGPRYFNFPYSVRCVALKKLELVDQN